MASRSMEELLSVAPMLTITVSFHCWTLNLEQSYKSFFQWRSSTRFWRSWNPRAYVPKSSVVEGFSTRQKIKKLRSMAPPG